MLCRKPALSNAALVEMPPPPWPSSSGRVAEPARSRNQLRPSRAAALVKEAVRLGALDAVFAGVAAHALNGSFQEEAMMALAVLCHSGEAVPGEDEAVWVRVQEAMRLHSGRAGVITARGAFLSFITDNLRQRRVAAPSRCENEEVGLTRAPSRRASQEACVLLAVLACQEDPATAGVAATFTGELVSVLQRHHAHAPAAVSAACHALTCVVRSTAEDAASYVRSTTPRHLCSQIPLSPAQRRKRNMKKPSF